VIKMQCSFCGEDIDTTIGFLTFVGEAHYAHTTCYEAEMSGKDIIDWDRGVLVKPGGRLEPLSEEDQMTEEDRNAMETLALRKGALIEN